MKGATGVIRGQRLDLVVAPGPFLDACFAGDREEAHRLVEFSFPDGFPGDEPWIRIRRQQVLADPSWEPWSLRAMVLRDEKRMVGDMPRDAGMGAARVWRASLHLRD